MSRFWVFRFVRHGCSFRALGLRANRVVRLELCAVLLLGFVRLGCRLERIRPAYRRLPLYLRSQCEGSGGMGFVRHGQGLSFSGFGMNAVGRTIHRVVRLLAPAQALLSRLCDSGLSPAVRPCAGAVAPIEDPTTVRAFVRYVHLSCSLEATRGSNPAGILAPAPDVLAAPNAALRTTHR